MKIEQTQIDDLEKKVKHKWIFSWGTDTIETPGKIFVVIFFNILLTRRTNLLFQIQILQDPTK